MKYTTIQYQWLRSLYPKQEWITIENAYLTKDKELVDVIIDDLKEREKAGFIKWLNVVQHDNRPNCPITFLE